MMKKSNSDRRMKEAKSKQKNGGGSLMLHGKTIQKGFRSWKWRKRHYAMFPIVEGKMAGRTHTVKGEEGKNAIGCVPLPRYSILLV